MATPASSLAPATSSSSLSSKTKAKFSSRNLNAVYKAPLARHGPTGDGHGGPGPFHASNRMLVLRPVRGALAAARVNAVAAPAPINTPSLRKEILGPQYDPTATGATATARGHWGHTSNPPGTTLTSTETAVTLVSIGHDGHGPHHPPPAADPTLERPHTVASTVAANPWLHPHTATTASATASSSSGSSSASASPDRRPTMAKSGGGSCVGLSSGRWGDDAVEEDIVQSERAREAARRREFPDLGGRGAPLSPPMATAAHDRPPVPAAYGSPRRAPPAPPVHRAHDGHWSSQDVRSSDPTCRGPSRSVASYHHQDSYHGHAVPPPTRSNGAYEDRDCRGHSYFNPQDARYDLPPHSSSSNYSTRPGHIAGGHPHVPAYERSTGRDRAPARGLYDPHHRENSEADTESPSQGPHRSPPLGSIEETQSARASQGEPAKEPEQVQVRPVPSTAPRHPTTPEEDSETAWKRASATLSSSAATCNSVWKMSEAEVKSATVNDTSQASGGQVRILRRPGPRMLFDHKSGTMVNADDPPSTEARAPRQSRSSDRASTGNSNASISTTTQNGDCCTGNQVTKATSANTKSSIKQAQLSGTNSNDDHSSNLSNEKSCMDATAKRISTRKSKIQRIPFPTKTKKIVIAYSKGKPQRDTVTKEKKKPQVKVSGSAEGRKPKPKKKIETPSQEKIAAQNASMNSIVETGERDSRHPSKSQKKKKERTKTNERKTRSQRGDLAVATATKVAGPPIVSAKTARRQEKVEALKHVPVGAGVIIVEGEDRDDDSTGFETVRSRRAILLEKRQRRQQLASSGVPPGLRFFHQRGDVPRPRNTIVFTSSRASKRTTLVVGVQPKTTTRSGQATELKSSPAPLPKPFIDVVRPPLYQAKAEATREATTPKEGLTSSTEKRSQQAKAFSKISKRSESAKGRQHEAGHAKRWKKKSIGTSSDESDRSASNLGQSRPQITTNFKNMTEVSEICARESGKGVESHRPSRATPCRKDGKRKASKQVYVRKEGSKDEIPSEGVAQTTNTPTTKRVETAVSPPDQSPHRSRVTKHHAKKHEGVTSSEGPAQSLLSIAPIRHSATPGSASRKPSSAPVETRLSPTSQPASSGRPRKTSQRGKANESATTTAACSPPPRTKTVKKVYVAKAVPKPVKVAASTAA